MDINLGIFTGNLTTKPELRQVGKDKLVTDFSLAVGDGFGDKAKTYFPKFTAWGALAKFITTYGDKGDMLVVKAKYVEKFWEKDGVKRKEIVFVVEDLKLKSKVGKAQKQGDGSEAYLSEGAFPESDFECEIFE